ncbi:hypothetical protein ACDX41_26320, partial [Citrobacter meridianamericanus]
VYGNGQDSHYRIRKYAMEMQLDHGRQLLSAVNLHDGADAIPEPVLMLLHDPMRNSIALRSRASEGVPTGDFELPAAVERDGPWLVLP